MKQFMIRQEIFTGVINRDTIIGQSSFLSFILLAEDGVIEKKLVEKALEKDKNVSAFFKGRFEPQQLIKNAL
jgi:hypothetical protein